MNLRNEAHGQVETRLCWGHGMGRNQDRDPSPASFLIMLSFRERIDHEFTGLSMNLACHSE